MYMHRGISTFGAFITTVISSAIEFPKLTIQGALKRTMEVVYMQVTLF